MRLALSNTMLSRDQVVDQMNEIASKEGIHLAVSKATLDGWVKDSDPSRMPGPVLLTLFCKVMGTVGPISAMLRPLGAGAIGPEEKGLLAWARAEQARRKAARRAKMALDALEV
jgi:hypothetical protein